MTVKELIKRLSSFPEDSIVQCWDCEYGYSSITDVSQLIVVDKTSDEDATHVSSFDVDTDELSVGDSFVAIK